MQKEKFRLFFLVLLTFLVLGTTGLFTLQNAITGNFKATDLAVIFVPLIVVIFMAFFFVRRYRDIKEGLPLEDERSRKVMQAAAAKTFYVSLYWLLVIGWFEPFFAGLVGQETLTASQTTGGGIAGMAVCFLAFWIYYNKSQKI